MQRSLAFLMALTGLAFSAGAAQVQLSLDWNGVELAGAYPVTTGIPFPRGALADAANVRLLAGDKELPVQVQVLATWPDKSVKWLLLDFQPPVGAKAVTVEYGRDVKRMAVDAGMRYTDQDGVNATGVRVETGAISFLVKNAGCGFIDELSFGGHVVSKAGDRRLNIMDALHVEKPADYAPMQRYLKDAQLDPSKVVVESVKLETAGPLRAVVVINGKYTYKKVGSTIVGTEVKGDCPFRIRLTAYAGQSIIRVEHFFVYEGDGDHDFIKTIALKVPLPEGPMYRTPAVQFIAADNTFSVPANIAGLHQGSADGFDVWKSDGKALTNVDRGRRFEGVVNLSLDKVGIAIGIKDFWQNYAGSLHGDLVGGELAMNFWPPESPPLDFRRHAREWSVGETGEPDDKDGSTPVPFARGNYRLASKGVGKTHYGLIYLHDPKTPAADIAAVYRLFNQRPLAWAPAAWYADSLALGRYRQKVDGEHDEIEKALDQPAKFWRHSQEHFGWYGFWLYGNVCQSMNEFNQLGRWDAEFGRWGWANGDSVGRLAYALMLQGVRKCQRGDLEFAEKYLYAVHDVCSTHTPAYPHHYGEGFNFVKGAAHRHGAWPWACPYVGARGAHPVGAKIYYFLTGEGHARDILDEVTQLAVKNPNGGEGDGPLGINAQVFLYQWEATGDTKWRDKLKEEIDNSDLKKATGGWTVMMNAAFGIYNALEEYMELTGDKSLQPLAARFADEAMPEKMKTHWTWGGYYRVYAAAYNITGDEKYRKAIDEMLPLFLQHAGAGAAAKLDEKAWPGKPGGPTVFVDANIVRDVPFALYSLHAKPAATTSTTTKEGK